MPQYVQFRACQNLNDGEMVDKLLCHSLDVVYLKETEKFVWKRLVDETLNKKADCIIDAGALLASKSLQREIVPYLAKRLNV
jgi:hypothetical protein